MPPFRVGFYNLENLFHPDDDPETNDDEFTPEGLRNWTYYKYRAKLHKMSKVILSMGAWDAPAIVGLEELENKEVLQDLVNSEVLRKIPYRMVHYESPDKRGIDVALIYRKDRFELLHSEPIPLRISKSPTFKSRDMLYVKGIAQAVDTLHIFVCHWPSKYSGQAISEPKRIKAAQVLQQRIDSIFKHNGKANIIVGGDFNDDPESTSLRVLTSTDTSSSGAIIENLMHGLPANEGSHKHHGIWSYLDQILISNSMSDSIGIQVENNRAHVHAPEFILEEDLKYPGMKPYRHFLGFQYHGGFSDHLPVYIDLKTTSKEIYR